eukprot:TRINITY_DN14722_c0_g2_i2.p1 TRINITY_DN14722_c0_g2~~TRINITY_DN14722_c0_g2_i2.p1  ORF type:complete len:120 (-),score=12.70 TRINITY_DN14722_c0_g2_i2:39-398(-)
MSSNAAREGYFDDIRHSTASSRPRRFRLSSRHVWEAAAQVSAARIRPEDTVDESIRELEVHRETRRSRRTRCIAQAGHKIESAACLASHVDVEERCSRPRRRRLVCCVLEAGQLLATHN